jgi:hypothetical protein
MRRLDRADLDQQIGHAPPCPEPERRPGSAVTRKASRS